MKIDSICKKQASKIYLDKILRNTPDHLLNILSKIFRTLLYNMHLPEDEVEDAVARIKERKMGRLFENVTMDTQAERRNTAEARAELKTICQKLDSAQQELSLVQRERDIYKHILRMTARHCTDIEILVSLTEQFNLTKEQAAERLKQAFED